MIKSLLKDLDIILAIILPILCIPFVLIPPLNETIVRFVLGLPLVLFLPGYSLVLSLFPRKNDLSKIERIALSLILSLAIVPLLGLALNYIPFGIRRASVLVILSAFIISVSLFAWFRRLKLSAEERFRVPFESLLNFNLGQSFLDKGLSIVLIASIIGSSAILVYVTVTPKIGERFTEFYILGPNGTASDYPTNMTVGKEREVIIGIVNHEYENITYRLEINFNGYLIHEEYVFLIENEKWEIPFTFIAIEKGENQKLEFILYKGQQIEAYRKLHLWVNVK